MPAMLFISLMNGSAWGGSEEQWYRTALWLANNGYKVDVCCFFWKEKQQKIQQLQSAGCKLYLLPGKPQTKSFFGKLKLQTTIKKIPFEGYDFVLVNQGGWKDVAHSPFKKLSKRLSLYALTFHNYQIAEYPKSKLKILSEWINKSAVNITDAQKIFNVLEDHYHLKIPNKKLWYNPITFAPPENATLFPSLINDKYVWVMLATLDIERKGQDILIKTLSQPKWKKRNWILHLYGAGKDKLQLEQLISELKMNNKVELKGHTDNVKEVLANSHLLLQCTLIDAMPISVVEAMAMARPCIVSNVGDMPIWIKDGYNGFVWESVNEKC
jgi:glycosyltransferase involved in cell wall biosynthesis